jgi:hypothetical protein
MKDSNEKGSNSTQGKDQKLVDRKRPLARKVEGLYNGKEKETFKEEEQSVRKGGQSKVLSKLTRSSVHWENEWDEEE